MATVYVGIVTLENALTSLHQLRVDSIVKTRSQRALHEPRYAFAHERAYQFDLERWSVEVLQHAICGDREIRNRIEQRTVEVDGHRLDPQWKAHSAHSDAWASSERIRFIVAW